MESTSEDWAPESGHAVTTEGTARQTVAAVQLDGWTWEAIITGVAAQLRGHTLLQSLSEEAEAPSQGTSGRSPK